MRQLCAFGVLPVLLALLALTPSAAQAAVTPTGAYVTSIPIDVPSGINGLSPSVALVYSSDHAGHGPLGVGWNLSATSVISRHGPGRQLSDNRWIFPLSAPTLTSDDVFYLDGQRVVPCNEGGSSSVCPPNTYRTEDDDFALIECDPDNQPNWRVTQPDGTVLEFSEYTVADSVDGVSFDDVFGNRVEWYLSRISQAGSHRGGVAEHFPTLEFEYATPVGEVPMLHAIEYGGFELRGEPITPPDHKFRIEFSWSLRDDIRESYRSGAHLKLQRRLTGILVSVIGTPATRIRKYVLDYDYSPVTALSRLRSVQEFGVTDSDAYPEHTFEYFDDAVIGFSDTPTDTLPQEATFVWDHKFPGGVWTIDINNDGLVDLVRRAYDEESNPECPDPWVSNGVWMNQGSGEWVRDTKYEAELAHLNQSLERHYWARNEYTDNLCDRRVIHTTVRDRGVVPADLNGDGYVDFLYSHLGYYPYQICMDPDPVYWGYQAEWNCYGAVGYRNHAKALLGHPDSTFTQTPGYGQWPEAWVGLQTTPVSPNVVYFSWDAHRNFFKLSDPPQPDDHNWSFPSESICGRPERLPNQPYPTYGAGTQLQDVNGDGLPDMVVLRGWCAADALYSYERGVYLNQAGTGIDYTTPNQWLLPESSEFAAFVENHNVHIGDINYCIQMWGNKRDMGLRFADVNGDGLPDLVQSCVLDSCRGDDELPTLQNSESSRGSDLAGGSGGGSGAGYNSLSSEPAEVSESGTLLQTVWVNTGRGWELSPTWTSALHALGDEVAFLELNYFGPYIGCNRVSISWLESLCESSNPAPIGNESAFQNIPRGVELIDINGDGLDDFVRKDYPVSWSNDAVCKVFLNTGIGWSATNATEWHLPDAPRVTLLEDCPGGGCYGESGLRFMDYDGDGTLDVALNRDAPYEQYNGLFRGLLDVRQDRLQALSNPAGGEEAIVYELLTSASPNHALRTPMLVATEVTSRAEFDAEEGPLDVWESTTSYEYLGGASDPVTKEFLGFRAVITAQPPVNNQQLYTTRWYKNQLEDVCCLGRLQATMVSDDTSASGHHVYGADFDPDTTWVEDLGIHSYVESRWAESCPALGSPGPYFHPPTETRSFNWDPYAAGHPCIDTRGTVVYDDYGNVQETASFASVTAASPYRRSSTHYHVPSAPDWLSIFPKYSELYDDSGVRRRKTEYYYDGATSFETAPTEGYPTKIVQRGYDESGTTQDAQTWMEYSYTPAGNLNVARDPNLVETTAYWGDVTWPELLLSGQRSADNLTTFIYFPSGRLHIVTDPNGVRTVYDYDGLSRPQSVSTEHDVDPGPKPHVEYSYTFLTPYGVSAKAISTLEGNRTLDAETFSDGLGHVYLQVERGKTGAAVEKEVATSQVFDARGQVTEATLPYGGHLYDISGPKVYATFDNLGRPIETTRPGGYASTVAYGICLNGGSRYWWTDTRQENGTEDIRKHFLRDVFGRAVWVTECNTGTCDDPLGTTTGIEKTVYTYDYADQLTDVLLADGVTHVRALYDGLGRQVGLKDPDLCNCTDANLDNLLSGCAARFFYDNAGRISEYRSPAYALDPVNGTRITYHYDSHGRLDQKQAYGPDTYNYVYTYETSSIGGPNYLEGRLGEASVEGPSGEHTEFWYQYDSLGRLTKKYVGATIPGQSAKIAETSFAYNNGGLPTTASVIATGGYTGSQTYTFDALGRLNGLTDGQAQAVVSNVLRNDLGQLTQARFGATAATMNFTYRNGDPSGPAGDRRLSRAYSSVVSVYDVTYQYDPVGNITQITDVNDGTSALAYDYLGRLTTLTLDGTATERYAYDILGNRTRYDYLMPYDDGKPPDPPIEGFSGLTGSVLTLDRGITMVMRDHWASFGSAWGGTAGPHALRCFDDQGSPCTSPTLSLFYDQNGRLAVYQDHSQGTGAVYSYHPNGKIRQIIGGATPTKYYYGPDDEKIAEIDNGVVRYFLSPIYERDGASNVMYAFFNGSRIAKRVGTGAWQYYLTDHLGSIRVVLDASGTVTKRINYLPFGAIKSMSVGTLPGYLFNGNRKNAYGVYDYGARGYLPYLGVFTQADDIVADEYAPQTLNRYSYVLNNPVNRIDPTGHYTELPGASSGAYYGRTFPQGAAARRGYMHDWLNADSNDYGDYADALEFGATEAEQAMRRSGHLVSGSDNTIMYQAIRNGQLTYIVVGTRPHWEYDEVLENNYRAMSGAMHAFLPVVGLSPWTRGAFAIDALMYGVEGACGVKGAWGRGGAGLLAIAPWGTIARTGSWASRGGLAAVRLGRAGEAAVRAAHDIGPATKIVVNGVERIPDGLNLGTKVLSEVKNVGSLSYTQQLRDFAQYAGQHGLRFDLYVRPGAKLSGPLLRARDAGLVNILEIPF